MKDRYNKTTLPLIVVLLCCSWWSSLCAQNEPFPPKREFRAVWIATVNNIDYPRNSTVYSVALKEQYKKLIEKYKELGFNAIIFQIRPSGDALYPTDHAPWSKYLTGKQGRAPAPYFDPLEFFIEETHKLGMEFHAWLNPYRATTNLDTFSLSEQHMLFRHRDWMMKYGGKYYFNPALPEVRQHLTDVVTEVVENYNVDAIHFDDYFYPYRIKNVPLQDTINFIKYGRNFDKIEDWRRNNVDELIQMVFTSVKQLKPHVKFGISPFGVWRNRENDPRGSDTRAGVTSYDDLYADVVKWMKMGWIDYVVPQLYWSIGFDPANHEKLLSWWGNNTYGKHLYIGHAAYKVADNQDPAWHEAGEIPKQIKLNRNNFNSLGSVYFSSKYILQNPLGIKDSLNSYYNYPALLPEVLELSLKSHAAPQMRRVAYGKDAVKIKWKPNKVDKFQQPAYYVIYRFEGTKTGDFEDPRNIIATTPFFDDKKRLRYFDKTAKDGVYYTYAITAVNRQHSESNSSKSKSIIRTGTKVKSLRN